MVTTAEIDRGVELLRSLGASRVILFGSAASDPEHANDIDFGCEGLPPSRFYYAVGRLQEATGKPVDLVDLSKPTRFNRAVIDGGKVLHDAGRA
jgi:predicted nucleotidyltransferase